MFTAQCDSYQAARKLAKKLLKVLEYHEHFCNTAKHLFMLFDQADSQSYDLWLCYAQIEVLHNNLHEARKIYSVALQSLSSAGLEVHFGLKLAFRYYSILF